MDFDFGDEVAWKHLDAEGAETGDTGTDEAETDFDGGPEVDGRGLIGDVGANDSVELGGAKDGGDGCSISDVRYVGVGEGQAMVCSRRVLEYWTWTVVAGCTLTLYLLRRGSIDYTFLW